MDPIYYQETDVKLKDGSKYIYILKLISQIWYLIFKSESDNFEFATLDTYLLGVYDNTNSDEPIFSISTGDGNFYYF